MTVVGYVVIEYNQASRCPALEGDDLHDTEADARAWADQSRTSALARGRRETYAVARVEIVDG